MKKTFLLLCSVVAFLSVGCGDKVADPDALYQKYLKDDAARRAKVSECKLLSTDEQLKSQTCTIAFKADGDKEMKRHGGVKLGKVPIKVGN